MNIYKFLMLLLVVCLLGILVKMSENMVEGDSASQDIELFDYLGMSPKATEFTLILK